MDNKKSNKVYLYFIVVMILIIIFLLFYVREYIGRVGYLTPTGNVDVFNININCDCKDKECEQGEGKPVFGEDSNNSTISDKKGFVIKDHEGNWIYQNELNIFSNPAYEFKNIIAPESSNAYQFVIYNSNANEIKYNIKMEETNPYNINMMYKLKKNGSYIAGNKSQWVDVDELNTTLATLNSKSTDSYSLEWKWVSSSNDTEVGKTENAGYSLKINIVLTA